MAQDTIQKTLEVRYKGKKFSAVLLGYDIGRAVVFFEHMFQKFIVKLQNNY